MLRILFLLFIFYLLYKLIFDFILPVSKATSQVRKKMQEMQETHMRQQQQTSSNIHEQQQARATAPSESDYLDFEEVK
jgi:predicted Holliday junction resolvase-like endonuclease